MPWKFRDDISNGPGVIVLTDKQTDRQTKSQTDTTENNTPSLRYAARVLKIALRCIRCVFSVLLKLFTRFLFDLSRTAYNC